jgi:hypothetical protein
MTVETKEKIDIGIPELIAGTGGAVVATAVTRNLLKERNLTNALQNSEQLKVKAIELTNQAKDNLQALPKAQLSEFYNNLPAHSQSCYDFVKDAVQRKTKDIVVNVANDEVGKIAKDVIKVNKNTKYIGEYPDLPEGLMNEFVSGFKETADDLNKLVQEKSGLSGKQKLALGIGAVVLASAIVLGVNHLRQPNQEVQSQSVEMQGRIANQQPSKERH